VEQFQDFVVAVSALITDAPQPRASMKEYAFRKFASSTKTAGS
jgi:hypothetical protein